MMKSKRKRSEMKDKRESKLSIKILVDTKANKVLFAEAGKDFVDFLFNIMSLPIGTITKLLNVKGMMGCLGTLYKSIDSLSNDYFNDDLDKDEVLNARFLPVNVPVLSLTNTGSSSALPPCSVEFFMCNSCCQKLSMKGCYVTDWKGASCPNCGCRMDMKLKYFRPTSVAPNNVTSSSSSNGSGGYVKGLVNYMVMDDLEVKPLSTISGITLMSKFCIKDLSALEEKQVEVGYDEAIAMLKASLEIKKVLTTVLLNAKNK